MSYLDEIDEMNKSINLYLEASSSDFTGIALESKELVAKITITIHKIFAKLNATISKGKIKLKSIKQQKKIKDLQTEVKDIADVKIKIQNVWDYYEFANKTIDEFIKHPNEKTFKVMLAEKNKKIAIDELSNSLYAIARQMKSPSSKQFTITDFNTQQLRKGMKVAKYGRIAINVTNAAATTGGYLKNRDDLHNSLEKIQNKSDHDYEVYDQDTGKLSYDSSLREMDYEDEISRYNQKQERLMKTSDHIHTAATISRYVISLAAFFSALPKNTESEIVTVRELYDRLNSLKPGEVSHNATNLSSISDKYLTNIDRLNDMKTDPTLKLAGKIPNLISAYVYFHQALIDFYYSIIVSVISEDKKIVAKINYKPRQIINGQIHQNVESSSL